MSLLRIFGVTVANRTEEHENVAALQAALHLAMPCVRSLATRAKYLGHAVCVCAWYVELSSGAI